MPANITYLEPIAVNTSANFTFSDSYVSNTITVGNIRTDNLLYANGSPYDLITDPNGSNTQVQFNNNGVFGASANFTFNNSTNTLSVTNFTSSGNINLSSASNVTLGNVSNLHIAGGSNGYYLKTNGSGNLSWGEVSDNKIENGTSNIDIATANGNITMSVNGSANVVTISNTSVNVAGNLTATNLIYGSGSGGNITNANVISANTLAGTLSTAAQPNITSVGTLTSLTITGNVTAGNASLGNLVTANYFTGNGSLLTDIVAITAQTVLTNAQPNITSTGTLSGLTVGPNSSIILSGTTGYVKANNIQGIDGTATFYMYHSNVAGAGGVRTDLTVGTSGTGNLTVNGNASATNANLGNLVTANYFSGNGSLLSGISASNISGTIANANYASYAGIVVDAAQSNITSVGTLASLTVTANGNITMSGSDSLLSGANRVSATYLTGTLTTAAQTNITSVGTLVSLTSSGNITAINANLGNLVTANYFTGNGSLLSGISASNITGTVANATYATTAGSATTAGTVTTNAQPNITSTGTLASLSVSGNANFSGLSKFYTAQDRFSSITGATGVVTHNMSNGPIFYHTSVTANFTPNFTNVDTTDNYITVAILFIVQGATPYMPLADTANIQIGGSNVTVKWADGTAPVGGASGSVNIVSYSLIRNGGVWVVMGQGGNFA